MTDQHTSPIEELSNLHDTLAYFKRQAAKGHTAFASRVSEIEAQIAELEADVLAAYPAAETLASYTLRVLRESPVAPVAEAAPDGDDDAKAAREMDDEELNALVQNMIDYPDSEIDTAVWPAKEYILTEYQRRHPAPTDPRPDCTLCGGDGINAAGSASCPACNGSGYANEPALEATAQDDIAARLEDAAEIYNDYACDCDTDLYTAAAEEIRRVSAEVEAIRSAANTVIDAFKADAEKTRGELFKERPLTPTIGDLIMDTNTPPVTSLISTVHTRRMSCVLIGDVEVFKHENWSSDEKEASRYVDRYLKGLQKALEPMQDIITHLKADHAFDLQSMDMSEVKAKLGIRAILSTWVWMHGVQGLVLFGGFTVYRTYWYNDSDAALQHANVYADKIIAALFYT